MIVREEALLYIFVREEVHVYDCKKEVRERKCACERESC
jgi:hypothetical protein